MSDSSSRRGPRRLVLDGIDGPLQRLKWLKAGWTVTGKVYELPPIAQHDAHTVARYRPRRPDEYPENRASDWLEVVRQSEAAIAELTALHDWAFEQWQQQR